MADEIEKTGAGIAIDYDTDEFIAAVCRLLGDDRLWRECRENALVFARRYLAGRIYDRAWERLLLPPSSGVNHVPVGSL